VLCAVGCCVVPCGRWFSGCVCIAGVRVCVYMMYAYVTTIQGASFEPRRGGADGRGSCIIYVLNIYADGFPFIRAFVSQSRVLENTNTDHRGIRGVHVHIHHGAHTHFPHGGGVPARGRRTPLALAHSIEVRVFNRNHGHDIHPHNHYWIANRPRR